MIGSVTGVQLMPKHMIDSIMSFNCTLSGKIRPELFSVQKYAVRNILKLIQIRPLG